MDASLSELFNLYVFSTGRRIFALRKMKTIAAELDQKQIVALINRAVDHDAKTLRLEMAWEGSGGARDPQKVKRIDAKVDRTLTAIRDAVAAQAVATEPGDPIHEAVGAFLQAIFPAGVAAVTSLAYVDELAAVQSILKQLRGPMKAQTAEMGLGRLVDRLAALTEEYRAAQEEEPKAELSFGEVRAARALGQNYLLQVVAVVLGAFHANTAEHEKSRARLLAPVLQQDEEIRRYLRAQRPVDDVDPESGNARPSAPVAPAPTPVAPPVDPVRSTPA